MDPATAQTPPLAAAAPRDLCTDCGLSRSSEPKRCGRACQFIRPDYPGLERRTHGRSRDPERPDELHFGPFRSMHQAALRRPRAGAQWTGVTTRLAERLLESGRVDAVLTVTGNADDPWRPRPVLVTDPAQLTQCRGMRMGYAPLLALLEPALAQGYRRLGVIALPCQTYPLRALERELGLERLEIIGTPCSDNTSTEHFHRFLELLTPAPEDVTYLEFRADYYVELRFRDGSKREIPFLQLPISRLPADFWPLTCRTCVDYTNALADITVGYMAGRGEQWIIVRNERGEAMLELLGDEVRLRQPSSGGKRAGPVQGFIDNTERAAGGMPARGMPNWLRPIVGRLMPYVGPRGLELARARLEMKAAETLIHLRHKAPRRARTMVPAHVNRLVEGYRITTPQQHPGPRHTEARSGADSDRID
ncbi:MAG: Coenzyme F420 hydrogenase/dehydrogenase, beta subunit C-terminal domain [Halorhodospira halophila]|uniref:coenzyme F420 hydrogenase/dehydrogenase beta subunit N-terminal domain-containing protein n=1 Tax=Halorhodospira TaxID=85108 RepID=UPI001914BFE8|nr:MULTISPECIES: coenzyme F420 hydrogenase/dehydrogenase beta subunit N-terminal domain-containing protein [Halorhodospira]MBK5936440.1 coenzyme F420 hydrogenase [Halorhodospira halophila]MBK5943952.1 coenzyme F420 hydrogenase [Halorhodospira halophila]MCC3750982.1 Coenzyme F420 hydrogenase/dehydrogenase, beta subunit C-terminal domain [Halorhodospira halophila]MCG5527933.1 Coenzyme F420 hydrogenase/dehydrogenase, beta subunit C-terminal domain [Halorhodospira halophila]MCG5533261.1 Coenzyme F